MKNYFLTLIGAAAMLGGAASCSQEVDAPAMPDNGLTTVSVQIPVAEPTSRAVPEIPEGYKLRCIMQLVDASGAALSDARYVEEVAAGSENVSFTFIAPADGYQGAMFWADYVKDIDADYIEFRRAKSWEPAYNAHFEAVCPTTAIRRVLGEDFPFSSDAHARDAAITEYYVLAGLRAMGLPSQMQTYFTIEEANALWSCFNLRQYLQRTATTVSTVPAEIAGDLVLNIIESTDAYTTGEDTGTCAILRFGHAETLMPLLSLLRIPGCHYMTNYFDTVASHWRDFDVVPMAANIQFIVFKSRRTGDYYVRVDVNETPIALRPGDDSLYFPWGELRRFMMNCVPLHAQ